MEERSVMAITRTVEEQIFGLDVAMNHMLCVAVLQRSSQRLDVLRRALLIERAMLLKLLVQLALGSKLENQINTRRIVEVTVQSQDVGVAAARGAEE